VGHVLVSEVHAASIFNIQHLDLELEASYTSETSAESPTNTRLNNPRAELTSIITYRGSLKSVKGKRIGAIRRYCGVTTCLKIQI
jgi:hypothetical protein